MLYLSLDTNYPRSYTKQLYRQLSEKIMAGELPAETALPSTRHLAKDLGIARNTVLTVYDMLRAEGYISSVPGSRYRVNSMNPVKQPQRQPKQIEDSQTASLADTMIGTGCINFDSGLPALDQFPRKKWHQYVTKAWQEAPLSALGYDDPQGRKEFRSVLAEYLCRTRGIDCQPEQLIVTSGTKQGISLVAKVLLTQESEVWLEEPTNRNVQQIFEYYTKQIVSFEVDEEGIQPNKFPGNQRPDLLFVTPAHQFPMGGTLSIQRRMAVIDFARKTNAFILEDDYDSEFNYKGLPGSSLFALDQEQVIYAGTFSKTLFPSLRLGYLVVPKLLIPQFRKWKRLADHHSNSIYQLALMRFIEDGELERHIRKMQRLYKRRRDHLLMLLEITFGQRVTIYGHQAGMHIVAAFQDVEFTPRILAELWRLGVYIVPVEAHAEKKGQHTNQIILGYAQLSEEELKKGIDILSSVVSG